MSTAAYPLPIAPGQTGHTQYHNDHTADTQAHKVAFHPAKITDFPEVDFSSPPADSRALVVYDPDTGEFTLGADADASGLYVPTAQLAVNSGVATLDSAGIGAQAPKAHIHPTRITDNGSGTVYQRSTLNIIAGTGNVVDDAVNDRVTLNLSTADVRVIRLGTTATVNNTVTVPGAPGNLTDLTFTVAAGEIWDFEGYFLTQSTAAAGIKMLITTAGITGTGTILSFTLRGPHTDAVQSAGYTGNHREAVVYVNNGTGNNGNQSYNGFGAAASYSYLELIGGRIIVPTGQTGGTVRFSFAQWTQTAVDTSIIAGATKLVFSRATA